MKIIQAKKHKIGTYEIDKISLSCFDDKKSVLDDGIHTLACFHKDCDKNAIRSSIIYEGIRGVFILFCIKFYTQKKHKM